MVIEEEEIGVHQEGMTPDLETSRKEDASSVVRKVILRETVPREEVVETDLDQDLTQEVEKDLQRDIAEAHLQEAQGK